MNNPPPPNNGNHYGWDNPHNPHNVPIDTPILSSIITLTIIFFVYRKFKNQLVK